jgi:DNA-binding MarR family transcriptional regulator
MELDRRLVFLLNVAQRRLQRWIQAKAADDGVTAAQSGVLFLLVRRDGLLMGEAAAALDLAPSGMSGLVDRMVGAGLLEQRPDATDGRSSRLWLTAAGREALARARAGLAELNARLTEGFSEAEIEIVARWLASFQTKFSKGDDS